MARDRKQDGEEMKLFAARDINVSPELVAQLKGEATSPAAQPTAGGRPPQAGMLRNPLLPWLLSALLAGSGLGAGASWWMFGGKSPAAADIDTVERTVIDISTGDPTKK